MEYAILVSVGCGMNSRPNKKKGSKVKKSVNKKNKPEQVVFLNTHSRLWYGHTPVSTGGKPDYWFCKATKEEAAVISAAQEKAVQDDIIKRAMAAGLEVKIEVHAAPGGDAAKGVELAHARKLQKLADEVVQAMVATGDKWLKLCTYIRENKVAPKLVAHELGQKGFSKVQISKINKVANAPEEHWSKFAARTLGFKKVLELSRGNVQKEIAAQSGDTVVDIEAEVKRMEKEEGTSSGGTKTVDEVDWEAKLVTGATNVLRAAAAMKLPRQRTIDGKNGYVLVIKKSKS